MSLSVIGSGFGRTGTRSLKEALEVLGFEPCHHMEEVFENPHQVAYWQALARGDAFDPREAFQGYRAQVDWPGAAVWRESMDAFPEALVVHSHRPEEQWWASFSQTIGRLLDLHTTIDVPPHISDMMEATQAFISRDTFGGQHRDRETCLAAYRKRLEDVRAAVPEERLLVFDVAEGWEPLCTFLNVPVPDQPFPRRNDRTEFWANIGGDPG